MVHIISLAVSGKFIEFPQIIAKKGNRYEGISKDHANHYQD